MSELISYHLEDGIATLTLSNGKVNAISPAVVNAFNEALDQAEKDRRW
jgi:enoyl-CoA hydratase